MLGDSKIETSHKIFKEITNFTKHKESYRSTNIKHLQHDRFQGVKVRNRQNTFSEKATQHRTRYKSTGDKTFKASGRCKT